MSQYSKTIVAEFLSKAHSPVVEMILFWKQTPRQLLKFTKIFETAFLKEHSRVSFFSQSEKAITREQNVIDFCDYFIYGSHFMNHHTSNMHHIRVCKEHNKQSLDWIRLIQAGKIHSYFVDLKRYFSLSKLIQSLFKSVFNQLSLANYELGRLPEQKEQTGRVRERSNSYSHLNKTFS